MPNLTRHAVRLGVATAALSLAVGAFTPAQAADQVPDPGPLAARRAAPAHSMPTQKGPGFTNTSPGSDQVVAKLGSEDLRRLHQAVAQKKATVTVLVAAKPGSGKSLKAAIKAAGGSVGRAEDHLGYVRATVPTTSVNALAQRSDVLAIDLNRTYATPNPQLAGPAGTAAAAIAPPGATTPANNPYLPVNETGSVDFVATHPQWDGRGVTVGVLDSGVDLDHPALQRTTTGVPKVVDWVTATDPVIDSDPSWLRMDLVRTGPSFTSSGITWKAPAGQFKFALFNESATAASEFAGDLNRDGDTKDRFGVLYASNDHRIWVDSNQNSDFTDEAPMSSYAQGRQVGHFGVDNPDTAVSERVPFVVQYREDVDLSPLGPSYVGKVADYVNLGLVAAAHGTHVAGIIAGNGLFGGMMRGAAPGAQIVSSRACTFSGGCTAVALTEGMIDLVTKHGADVVNVSIGGLTALNDDSDAIAVLYDELVRQYNVQIVVSAGNDGPGVNTVSSPSTSDSVISVAASVSKKTWWSNYGAEVRAGQGMFSFSARGPAENGGMKPTLSAPGAAISTVPMWQMGQPVPETGYTLPPGYAMYNGTSMAAPQAVGSAALLLSAAKATATTVTAKGLRTALIDGATLIDNIPTAAQGAGLINVPDAWNELAAGVDTGDYTVSAPVCTTLSHLLAVPHKGKGVFNRCLPDQGGQQVGQSKRYDVTVTRTSGAGRVRHELSWTGNDGTFSAPSAVTLGTGEASSIAVTATPTTPGLHSAILRIDDKSTTGIDLLVPVTVVVADQQAAPTHAVVKTGSVRRGTSTSFFVPVPEGVANVQLALEGVGDGQVRVTAIDPTGMPVDSNASNRCYTNYSDPKACNPTDRSYTDPMSGVWEFQVEARRTSPLMDNAYRATATLQGFSVEPANARIASARVYRPESADATATNSWGTVTAHAAAGQVGRLRDLTASVSNGGMSQGLVQVPRDVTEMELTVTPRQADANLDVYLVNATAGLVARLVTPGPGGEHIRLHNPLPGTYGIFVAGTDVPSGTTQFDYHERLFSGSLGTVTVDDSQPKVLQPDQQLLVKATVTVTAEPLNSSGLVAMVPVANDHGTTIGSADIHVESVTTPDGTVLANLAPMVGFDMNNAGAMVGDKQIASQTKPVRWSQTGGYQQLALGDNGRRGTAYDINEAGTAVGQIELATGGLVPGVWEPDGTLTSIGTPDWRAYTQVRAVGINDAGQVVGDAVAYTRDSNGVGHLYDEAWLWTAADGFRRLPHLSDDPTETLALAINDAGYVVGSSKTNGTKHAVMWHPDGTIEDLGALPGMTGSEATAISQNGTVVGTSGDDAFVWTRSGGMHRLADYGFDGSAVKVTADGWVLGSAEVQPEDSDPVVWDPQGRVYDLNRMVDPATIYATIPMTINDLHQVVMYGYVGSGSGLVMMQLPSLP